MRVDWEGERRPGMMGLQQDGSLSGQRWKLRELPLWAYLVAKLSWNDEDKGGGNINNERTVGGD